MHCFRNDTGEPARFEVELTPGHAGFERALQIGYGLAGDGKTNDEGVPKNLLHLALLAEWSEIRGPGLMRAISPLMAALAALARRRGVDAMLVERYVVV
jgi:hypothetical protein